MTDLEDLWDDVPVGPVPLDAILRQARRSRTPERRLRRSLYAVAAVGGMAAAFVVGTLVVAPDPAPPAPPSSVPPAVTGPEVPDAPAIAPVAFHGALNAPSSCSALLRHYVRDGVKQVSAYGWSAYVYYYRNAPAALPTRAANDTLEGNKVEAPVTSSVTDSDTGTNVQEAGVDEPDLVKTDGTLLVRIDHLGLTTYDVGGTRVRRLGSLDLPGLRSGEILLSGDTVVAIGGTPSGNGTRVETVDVTDPAAPSVRSSVVYDAPQVSVRQHGDAVRVILQSALPKLDFTRPRRGTSYRAALAANRQAVRESTIDDWLPTATSGGQRRQLVRCQDVALPRADLGLGTMTVLGFDATPTGDPAEPQAIGLAGAAPLAYESTDRLYLAAEGGGPTAAFYDGPTCFGCGGDGTTHLYEFTLDGAGATYVGAGEVDGRIADRWSMDEAGGVLRLAVEPSSQTGPANSIVTMRTFGDRLEEVGRLDGIGRGEQLQSVRWFGSLALLVTYRQVDPLFAVDLAHVRRPQLVGRLRLPGFSAYLHPLGPLRVIGMGQLGGSAQAGLFDTHDLRHLRLVDRVVYPRGSYARAGDEPRQFTWLPQHRVALTVVSRGGTGYVSVLQLGDGHMANRLVPVDHGDDVARIRTVPLPDGRVVLVTGETTSFLDLDAHEG